MGQVGVKWEQSESFESKTVQNLESKTVQKNDGEGVFVGFLGLGVGIWPPKTPSSPLLPSTLTLKMTPLSPLALHF